MEITKTDTEGKIKGKFLNEMFMLSEACSNILLDLLKALVTLYCFIRVLNPPRCEHHEVKEFWMFCSLMYPVQLELCLEQVGI